MLRGAGHDTSETRTPFRCAVRALWKKDLRPDERLARVVIPRRCHRRRNGRTERQSTRIFGEYAFLEDSRYASQPKNISGRIRREWSEQPRCGVLWSEVEGRVTFQRADLCDAFIKVGGCRYDPRLWNPEIPLTTLTS